jgi:hypothetical protein
MFLIVAALLIAFVTIAAVIVRAGGHDPQLTSPAAVSGPALPSRASHTDCLVAN